MSTNTPSKERKKAEQQALAHDSPLTFLWIVTALKKSWPLVLALTLLGGGGSMLYSKTLSRVYEASATVEFDPDVIRPMGEKGDQSRFFGAFVDIREYYETQYLLISSDRVLSQVVRDLSLTTDANFAGKGAVLPLSMEDAVAALRGRLRVDPTRGSRLVTIHVEDGNPAQARKLCDAVARGYVAQNLDKQVSATSDAVVWLSSQLEHFKGNSRRTRTNSTSSHYDEALSRTRVKRQELSARYTELAKVNDGNPDQLPASELLSNAFLAQLRKNYQDSVRDRREAIAEGKGDNHPSVKRIDEKISQAKKDLLEEVKNIQGALARDLAQIQRQESGESGLYEESKKRAVDLNLKELEYHRLDRNRAQNEKVYGVLIEQMKNADLARMMNINNVRLVDPPAEPKFPIRPKVATNVLVGFVVGVLVGLAVAIGREQLDNTIRTPSDVETYLGTTFLGLLPLSAEDFGGADRTAKKKRKRRQETPTVLPPELYVHERPLSGLAEAARTVRTNLLFMNPDNPHRLILVTSAAPSEGKTTVACSLAISLAQSGKRVCIVDCDMRRPRLHRIFDRLGDAGITYVVGGEATLDEVALPTIVENLDCVPSGPIPPNPGDVLHSVKFRQFVEALGQRYDKVILDSPPIAAVADSAIISTLVDGVIFVIRAFQTTRALGKQGMRALRDVDAPVLGALLNAGDLAKEEGYYQYYYYKREGYAPRHAAGTIPGMEEQGDAAPPPN
ncbi:hypothetical protein OUZ56_032465 [Daphnia magna]|uniref:Uncharacterized protein n=1 Tax=Daphnia magna TaxID=35525 RepID=A0ABR0B8Z6_9CRUS|nr:hypothetical protein OUZ56_032465 [Daphnia magna]